jgi:hypothetical protein
MLKWRYYTDLLLTYEFTGASYIVRSFLFSTIEQPKHSNARARKKRADYQAS